MFYFIKEINSYFKLTLIVIAGFLSFSCSSEEKTDPEIKLSKFMLENKNKADVISTKSGLQYKILREGSGEKPYETDKVTVHYKGTLTDGTPFDSSYDRKETSSFPLNRVIKGWTEGLQLMKVGSKFEFFIPYQLAYGDRARGHVITARSDLIFIIELISIKKVRLSTFLKKKMKEKGVIIHPSKLAYKIIKEGTGRKPVKSDTVSVHYEGRLPDGTVFDSSYGKKPFDTLLTKVITGWTIGLQEMKEGAKYEFYIPSHLAYGERGSGEDIAPNQDLIFTIELLKIKADFLEEMAKEKGVLKTSSGLLYKTLKKGTGNTPSATDTVEVHYEGSLPNGTVFDSSYKRGETIEFPLDGVIKGWTEGLQLMKEGGTMKLYIPSDLAYGARGVPQAGIAPDQPLIFKVELVKIIKEQTPPSEKIEKDTIKEDTAKKGK